MVMDTWRGVIGPRGMSAEQIAFWDQLLAKAVATDTWKQAKSSATVGSELPQQRADAQALRRGPCRVQGRSSTELGLIK